MAEDAFTMGVGDVLGLAAGGGIRQWRDGETHRARLRGESSPSSSSSPLPLLQQRVTPCPVAVELPGAGGAAGADTVPSVW